MEHHPTFEGDIAIVLYPNCTALDLVGPQHMFSALMGAHMHFVAKTNDVIETDTGLRIQPTMTFADCPRDLLILCVPGGAVGTTRAMQDEDTIAFVRDRGSRAKYVTSVCTGSLVLGAAGLLDGYRATSHWMTVDLLPHFGATPVRERVVRDRNRITGGGVTAGIDFGLTMIKELCDTDYAKGVQLLAEYDPAPPLDAGSPEKAGEGTVALVHSYLGDWLQRANALCESLGSRLPQDKS
jgi:cyclohexyl-isocyanide hydratase